MAVPRHRMLDVVELVGDAGRWPSGTTGTVVELDDRCVMVEIADELGRTLDFVTVPHGAAAPAAGAPTDLAS